MRITRKLIDERLKRVESCEIEWFGARHSNESASAPDDLPENACVAIEFSENHDHYITTYKNFLDIDVYAVIDQGVPLCQDQEDISVAIAIYRKYWPKGDLWLYKNGEFQNLSTPIGAALEGVTI